MLPFLGFRCLSSKAVLLRKGARADMFKSMHVLEMAASVGSSQEQPGREAWLANRRKSRIYCTNHTQHLGRALLEKEAFLSWPGDPS